MGNPSFAKGIAGDDWSFLVALLFLQPSLWLLRLLRQQLQPRLKLLLLLLLLRLFLLRLLLLNMVKVFEPLSEAFG